MKFEEQEIPGVFLITPQPHTDDRGVFRRIYCKHEYSSHGLEDSIVQSSISENRTKYTLRGFHYQDAPHVEDKSVVLLSGSIFSVMIDLRPASPTYHQWRSFELSAVAGTQLFVPAGCANGFLTLEDNTTLLYEMSECYSEEHARGIRYNDRFFNVEWPALPERISEKDATYADYQAPPSSS